MAELLIGSSDYSSRRVSRGSRGSSGLLVALLVLPCLVLPATVARAGGVGNGALRVTATVNGRGDSGARPPALRVGRPVVKRYRLVNRGEAHLYGVRVTDPGVPRGTVVRCPDRPLPALGELECVARFQAASGVHRGTVRAQGSVPSLGRLLTATARTGYTGITGDLRLTEQVAAGPVGRRSAAPGLRALAVTHPATLTYTVTNHGNRPLHAVRVEDTALGLRAGAVDCAGRPGTVPLLAPGASARCTATVRRPPGTHRSTGLASGSDRVTTYGPGGERVPAPTLVGRSAAVFTLRGNAAAAGTPGPPGRPAGPGRGSGAATRGPGGPGAPAGSGGSGGPSGPGRPGALAAGAADVAGGGRAPAPAPGAGGAPGGAVPLPGAPGAPVAPAAAGAPGAAGTAGAAGGAVVEAGAGAVAPDGALPGALPPTAVPPARPLGPTAASGTADAPTTGVGNPDTPAARRAALLDDEGFLGRVRRRGREASEFGVVSMLLLLLIPGAVAAALLGNRRS
ncbi:hypothetical protein [Streptomyces sp. NPDC056525]|uniref:DUF7507 domain-containing protein n=1 Tax=unclassified Streptomyces TaxID=2593676 RepID=UPI0036C27EB1